MTKRLSATSVPLGRVVRSSTSMSSSSKSRSARINFASLTPNNLGTVRKLNSVLFPIKYSEKFYQDVLLPEAEDFCKLGLSLSYLPWSRQGLNRRWKQYITMMYL